MARYTEYNAMSDRAPILVAVARRARTFLIAAVLLGAAIALAATIDQAVLAKFEQLEKQYQLPEGILGKIAMHESGGSATIQAKTSSAVGMFQWLESSWIARTKQSLGHPLPLEARKDPFISAEMTAIALADTKGQIGNLIQQAKVDMIVGLYMGHFLGTAGAHKFFTLMLQNPNAPAAPHFPKAAVANKGVFYRNGSASSFTDIVNYFAQQLRLPGISRVLDYSGTYSGNLRESRILGDSSRSWLEQRYTGPMPSGDEFDYPYSTAPLPAGSCEARLYCSGNTVMVRDSACNVSVRESCQFGCADGQCLGGSGLMQRCPDGSLPFNGQCLNQRCPDGSMPYNGMCAQQQCPQGMIPYNGTCVSIQGNQQMLPMSQQPFGGGSIGGLTQGSGFTGTGATVGTGATIGTGATVGTVQTTGQTTGQQQSGGGTSIDTVSRIILADGGATSTAIGGSGSSRPGGSTETIPASISELLYQSQGQLENTATGMNRNAFDLLRALDAEDAFAPVSGRRDTQGFGGATPGTQGGLVPGGTSGGLGGSGQDTFTSPDLRDTGSSGSLSPQRQASGFLGTVLSNLRAALLKALDFLVSLRVRLTQQR